MAWVAAGVAVGSSLLSSATGSEDHGWKEQAKAVGRGNVSVTFSRARAWEATTAKASAIEKEALFEYTQLERERIRTEAKAVTSAAAAGVAGVNVDQVVNDISANAAEVKQSITGKLEAGKQKLRYESQDIFWQADSARSQLTVTGSTGDAGAALLKAGLDGTSAYLANR